MPIDYTKPPRDDDQEPTVHIPSDYPAPLPPVDVERDFDNPHTTWRSALIVGACAAVALLLLYGVYLLGTIV